VLQIDEKNLGLLAVGQSALASADAYPDQRFSATLTYINPAVDISRASVEVKLTSLDPPAYLRQDMTVSVDIEVDRRASAVSVPVLAVHDLATATPWVLLVRNGRARALSVHIGLRAGSRVEILDGLSSGDLVIPVAADLRAGQRLRAILR
jgi:HlyD family secretion protein